jgi:hypothetical protein
MNRKYEIHNQLTGLLESAQTFEDAIALQARIKNEYFEDIKHLFVITVLVQNEDGSWTQSVANENGDPIVAKPTTTEEN